jgi:hypothetical protein
MRNYKILRSVYIDKDGNEKVPFFYIQRLERILWFSYWKDITHEGDFTRATDGKTITQFQTYDDAYSFIVNVLSKDLPRQTRISELVGQVDL